MPLNTLARSLAGICRERPLQEKWLVAPSLRVGNQWIETVARAGHAVVNVRVKTMATAVLEIASPLMATLRPGGKRGAALVAGLAGDLVVDRAWRRATESAKASNVAKAAEGYLSRLPPSASLARSLRSTLRELRLAGFEPGGIDCSTLEVPAKGRELDALHAAYLEELAARGLVDYADACRLAERRLHEGGSALRDDVVVLVPEDALEHLSLLERRVAEVIPRQQLLTLQVDRPRTGRLAGGGGAKGAKPTDAALLAWLASPADAPAPSGDGTVRVFRAVGEVNEVREVLRTILAEGVPLDEVELMHTDYDTYVPLAYELLMRHAHQVRSSPSATPGPPLQSRLPGRPGGANRRTAIGEAPPEPTDLPATFAEGLPSRYTRPGRALSAWVAWARDGFPQSMLVSMIRDGLLTPPAGRAGGDDAGDDARDDARGGGGAPGFAELASTLRSLGIGAGRERYLPRIDDEARAVRCRLARLRRDDGDDGGDGGHDGGAAGDGDAELARSRAERRLDLLACLRDMVERLIDPRVSPPPDAGGTDVLRAAVTFLTDCARAAGKLDAFARVRLVEEIETALSVAAGEADKGGEGVEGGEGDRGDGGATGLNEWEWLARLPAEPEARVAGSGPRPGKLHVSRAAAHAGGGHSGRAHTFVVGLDEGRVPGAGLQDPLLLDGERGRLSPDLPTAARRLDETTAEFASAFARLRGRVTLSFPCRSLADDREAFASSAVVAAYRILSGERDGDQAALARWLPPPVSFAPSSSERALDEGEWWLRRLCGAGPVADPEGLVDRRFPHLARGRFARESREGLRFTVYDGRVPDAGGDLDPASEGARPLSATSLETLGRCPRAYFFRYALRIEPPEDAEADPGTWLDAAEAGTLLHDVFREFVEELVAEGSRPAYDRHVHRLREILDAHVARYRGDIPPPSESVFLDQARELREAAEVFLREEEVLCATSEPVLLEEYESDVPVELPGARTVRVRGRIDRIDRTSAGEFAVWDYKTGSPYRYRAADPFDRGRVVQHALYLEIARAILRRQMPPGARVARFGYFFPGRRGRGERIMYAPGELADGPEVLSRLCDIVTSGAFIATDEAGDCTFCDYSAVCCPDEEEARLSRAKCEHEENAALVPFRELRGREVKRSRGRHAAGSGDRMRASTVGRTSTGRGSRDPEGDGRTPASCPRNRASKAGKKAGKGASRKSPAKGAKRPRKKAGRGRRNPPAGGKR